MQNWSSPPRFSLVAVFVVLKSACVHSAPPPRVAPHQQPETRFATAALTADNWRQHPEIVEVRDIVAAVDRALEKKQLTATTATMPCGGLDSDITRFVDGNGRIVRVEANAGSEDSAYTTTATYDDRGTLRFVFIKAGAVSASTLEQRFWMDAHGTRLWQRDDATGPGWTWWRPGTDAWKLLLAPQALVRAGACALMQ